MKSDHLNFSATILRMDDHRLSLTSSDRGGGRCGDAEVLVVKHNA